MTPSEINLAWELVRQYGPTNSWTGTTGSLAAALGRALEEVGRLKHRVAAMEERQSPTPKWLERGQ